ncbi:MAG: hypothetical protein PHO26_01535 [Dehalococcoidia bacterium]|nr:hypothetical protein [Dehalococcoidia bacterium]MDD5494522.1 hypothetical protein [Dehalococcoidia bacterium]
MSIGQSKLINLADIEGKVSPHAAQVKGALKMRAEALSYVKDVAALAAYLGGVVENPGLGEDWAVSKEIYPGVSILFAFNRADTEFPARVRALYSGDKIRTVRGDELAAVTISCANQLLRYVRQSNPGTKLPEVCYKV